MAHGMLFALSCACALALVSSAAVSSVDSMVVSRADDVASSTEPTVSTMDLPTTAEPPAPLKITEMDVKSEVSLRYSHTAVVTRMRNPASVAQEATFRVLLPETAFISGFVMTLNGTSYKAYVKEKEEAKKIFENAVSQGIGAAHIATKARDSNHFTVSVNVEPNTEAVFNLTYEELLVRRNNVYSQALNLHPGEVVPTLTVAVHVKEANRISSVRAPPVSTGNEIDMPDENSKNEKAVITQSEDGKEFTVTFKPDLEEQKRLMEIYKAKAQESAQQSSWPSESPAEGALGQFVVQYDVERPEDGEILVNDGYFVHFLAPKSLPPLNKYVVFVLDQSGSMIGRKMDQVRTAMQHILSDLNAGDFFSIVGFSSDYEVYDISKPTKSQSHDGNPSALPPPFAASAANVDKAKGVVAELQAGGGTNIDSALEVASKLVQGVNTLREGNNTENALEPIIIFLTDGEPTVGEYSTNKIIWRFSERNSGPNKAILFTLAFGEDADRTFLRTLSLRGDGFMRHIYEAADAALQLTDFYRQVSSPLLAHVNFTYPPEQVSSESLTKSRFRSLFLGSELVVAGRLAGEGEELDAEVQAFCGVQDKKKYKIFPKVPVPKNRTEFYPLERLWAYLTVRQLLDDRDALSDDKGFHGKKDELTNKTLAIALKYSFVTAVTSLVVVKPNATSAVDAESVAGKPLPSPYWQMSTSNSMSISPLSLSSSAQNSAYGLSGNFMTKMGSGLHNFRTSSSTNYRPISFYSPGGFPGQPGPQPLLDVFADPVEESDYDSYPSSFSSSTPLVGTYRPSGAYPNPPLLHPSLLTTPHPAISTAPSDPLKDYPWVTPLIDVAQQTLKMSVNGTEVTLKLDKGQGPEVDVSKSCPRATDGAGGVCVYLTRCAVARLLSAEQYRDTYCSLDGLAGVCCPSATLSVPFP